MTDHAQPRPRSSALALCAAVTPALVRRSLAVSVVVGGLLFAITRPEHAFRAGFQAFLSRNRIDEEVIDAIVGHLVRSVRSRHYAGAESLWERMVEAMELLPPIEWRGQSDAKVVQLR